MDLKKAVTFDQATSSNHSLKEKRGGFSLVEMLVVISFLSVLSILVSAGLQSVIGTTEDGQVSDIASTLVRARAYAMANNTYVFVGIQEVDASKASNGTQTAGTGRIGVAVVASNDGTRIYDYTAPGALAAPRITAVSPLHHYDNLDLLTSAGTGIANLPNNSTTSMTYEVASQTSLTTFSANPQYPNFGGTGVTKNTVIQYNPLGQAQIVAGPFTDAILQWIEIDLAPTHGTTGSGSNPATILIDGASGSVTTYRE